MRRFLAGIAPLLLLTSLAHAAPPAAPELDNKAYLLVDFDSGRVLAEKNSHEQLPPASLTKMMTSYIVEQALTTGRVKETDPVYVSEHAWCRGTSAESCMYLPVHGQASVIDMLRGIIIQSGNDASKAVAEHLGGSEPAFAELMNQQAARLGMKDTHFVNATGLPDPAHKTSAYDMAILARAIVRDSAHYYPIYAEKEFTYNGIKQGNRNALLYTDPSVDGLKTGHTEEAGFCLVSSSKRQGMRLIAVVMGAKSMQGRADQSRALFSWGFANFENVKPYAAGTVLGSPKVWFGKAEQVKVGLLQDVTLTLARGEASRLKASMQIQPEVKAPLKKGQSVGTLTLSLDGAPVATQAIVALEPVEEASFFVRLWHRITMFFSSLI
ncbi:MAG: serine-type D-Ala-D-Ala carboxypeptidase [Moraxellaceae bacterium]|jgi:D-alanyl-D-alanine carboxypeptidase (penicillin-binding protein 5/6)|nr:serine-type D-Ala-D-Ala carboxypeptidase [Moraxellaceae bacterium]